MVPDSFFFIFPGKGRDASYLKSMFFCRLQVKFYIRKNLIN